MNDTPERIDPKIEESWKKRLLDDFNTPSFYALKKFLDSERQNKATVYPPGSLIFNAFAHTPFEAVRVVILGQDPYHGKGQAHGLSFSVPEGVAIPRSLQNIYKEIASDLKAPPSSPRFQNGNLESWARQGVLLLNATLTVRASEAGSHQQKGWEEWTDAVIRKLNDEREGLVFLLWGNYAKAKGSFIDPKRHCVLHAAHPSPFSASSGFFGCRHFSKTNTYLREHGKGEIDWLA